MNPYLAAIIFTLGVGGLFYLDRSSRARYSFAIWIPMIWVSIGSSRVVSEWLNPGAAGSAANAYIEGNPTDRNVQTILIVLALLVLVRRSARLRSIVRANLPIVLFFAYCGLSIIWSDFPATSARRFIKALGDFVMVLVVLTEGDQEALLRFPARIGFVLLPISILLIRYFPEFARGFDDITGEPTYTGVTTSKNSLGMICLIFGLGSVYRFLDLYTNRGTRQRWKALVAHGATIVAALWLLLVAHSMTSLVCFGAATAVLLVTAFPSMRKRIRIHLLTFCIIAGLFCVLYLGVGDSVLTAIGRSANLTGRTEIWSAVLRVAANPLIGAGYESFWLGSRLAQISTIYKGINQAHNGYLEIYLNLGWLGLLFLFVLILTGYRNVIATLRRSPQTGRFELAYFIVVIIYNLTEASFKMMSPVWIMFLMVIAAVPTGPETQDSSTESAKALEAADVDGVWAADTQLKDL